MYSLLTGAYHLKKLIIISRVTPLPVRTEAELVGITGREALGQLPVATSGKL